MPHINVTRRLPQLAAQLTQQARELGLTSAMLKKKCAWLSRQIASDAAIPGLFDLWGSSSNFDESAKLLIVERGVLAAIGEIAGVQMAGPIVHAGLQHTYGYLLSTISTPYGFKRDRWTSTSLEQGFDLPVDVLGPYPSHGTLLANATVLAGLIAFRGDLPAERRLRRIFSSAAESVRNLETRRLEHSRIVEVISLRDASGRFRSVRIHTDLVPFPRVVRGCGEDCLLVYSVNDSCQPGAKLTTLFPVTPVAYANLLSADRFGNQVEIVTQYNLFVPGLTGQTWLGRRTLYQVSSRR